MAHSATPRWLLCCAIALTLSACGSGDDVDGITVDSDIPVPDTPTTISTASITIDGDVSDWSDVSAILIDTEGDVATYGGLDVTAMYTAQDDNYLYVLVTLVSDSRPTGESYNYWLYFENDDGFEFAIENYHDTSGTPYIRLWDITGADREYVQQTQLIEGLMASTSGDVLEIQVPKASLSTSLDYTVDFYTHYTESGVWQSDNGDSADALGYISF